MEFNVLTWDFNSDELTYFDVLPYLRQCYDEAQTKPNTIDEFKTFIERKSQYQWWSRCEYEMICHGWPVRNNDYKLDVHEQVMMNIDVIAQILFEEYNNTNNMKSEQLQSNTNTNYDEYMDKECIQLCNKLNAIDCVETTESCCGHYKHPYMIFFNCFSFRILGRLYRCVNKNYSDGKWRIECCCSDVSPCYGFLLRTYEPFKTETEMMESINGLIENIDYWMDEKWDDYFT